jgi:hypothetical protein
MFLAITMRAEPETPAILRQYDIYWRKMSRGDVNHTFQASLVDGYRTLHVRYHGVQFNREELPRDLRFVVPEGAPR